MTPIDWKWLAELVQQKWGLIGVASFLLTTAICSAAIGAYRKYVHPHLCDLAQSRGIQSRESAMSGAYSRIRMQTDPFPIFWTDDAGRMTRINDAFCDLLNVHRSDMLGDGWQTYVHRDDRERIVGVVADASKKSIDWQDEFRLVVKGNHAIIPVQCSASGMRDGQRLLGFVGMITRMDTKVTTIDDLAGMIRDNSLRTKAIHDELHVVAAAVEHNRHDSQVHRTEIRKQLEEHAAQLDYLQRLREGKT